MKSNAPWSVKGIERDARETAKEAAKREGMTVGEWLNQVIYQAGDPEEESSGDIEGLGLKDLVKAIEHLNRRLIAAESKSLDAVNNLSRSVGGVVERLQRIERTQHEGGAPGAPDNIEARLAQLESGGGERERIEALKALEKAVSQIALQFDSTHKATIARIDANERQLQEFASRLDHVGGDASGADYQAVDEISSRLARIERIAEKASAFEGGEASDFDAEFVENTGKRMRVLGDEIKRCGDQIRSIDQGLAKLSEQIDAAERRSSEGVQKVSETITELRAQFGQFDEREEETRTELEAAVSAATQHADERIENLQATLDETIARLSSENAGKGDLSIDLRKEDAQPKEDAAVPEIDDEVDVVEEDLAEEGAEDLLDDGFDDDLDDPFDLDDEAERKADGADDEEAGEPINFDLDKDESEDEASSPAPNVARDILEEVKQAFSGKRSKESEDAPAAEPASGVADDLESILAEAEAEAGTETEAEAEQAAGGVEKSAPAVTNGEGAEKAGAARTGRETAKAMLLAQSEDDALTEKQSDTTGKPDDYLKAARRAAQANARRPGGAQGSAQGKLSPKQKAILAAQARQQQRARTSELQPERPRPKKLSQIGRDQLASDDQEPRLIPGMFSFLRGEVPFLKTKRASGETEKNRPDAADYGADKSSALPSGARPMTIALGAAIALAAAALFFLVKDIIFGPTAPAETPAQTEQPPSGANMQFASPTDSPAIERLDAVINPRDLYMESISAYRSAADDAAVAQAIAGLERAAALGHPPAQLQLAEFYKLGQGVPKDLAQARTWYERAANGGNVLAMHRLGVMTARGEGGPADAQAAIGWFEQAADHGLVDAQYNLGTLYNPGDDGSASPTRDAGKAYYWYSLAARGGDSQAGALAKAMAGALTPEKKQELDAAVESWVAAQSDPEANTLASPS